MLGNLNIWMLVTYYLANDLWLDSTNEDKYFVKVRGGVYENSIKRFYE